MTITELLDDDTKKNIGIIQSGCESIDPYSLQNAGKKNLLDTLNAVMGKSYEDFKGYQYEVIKQILKGRDVLAVMPTSMGKSVCFQFPAIVRRGFTIVVEPLVALLKDQSGDLNREFSSDIAQYVTAYRTDFDKFSQSFYGHNRKRIIYVSPETLISPKFVRCIKNHIDDLQMLVVDEAHCISTWGSDFRNDYFKKDE